MVSLQAIRVFLICSLLTTSVVDGRRVKQRASGKSVTKHEQSAANRDGDQGWDDDWDSCAKIAADVKAIAAAGVEDGETSIVIDQWEGVYKCLRTEGESANTIMFIECGIDTKPGPKEGTPQCWERSKADDLQQFFHVSGQVLEGIGSGIAGLFGGGDGKGGMASLMPAGPSQEDLTQAIKAFCEATDDPDAEATLMTELVTSGKWDTLNPFEKAFTVAMLNSMTPEGSSAGEGSEGRTQVQDNKFAWVQLSQTAAGELEQQGKELGAAEASTGENWFTTLCRLIARIFEVRRQNRARAVYRQARAQNIGWDHVWGALNRAGFKAGPR